MSGIWEALSSVLVIQRPYRNRAWIEGACLMNVSQIENSMIFGRREGRPVIDLGKVVIISENF